MLWPLVETAREFLDTVNFDASKYPCPICLEPIASATVGSGAGAGAGSGSGSGPATCGAAHSFTFKTCFHSFHDTCLGHWLHELVQRRRASHATKEKVRRHSAMTCKLLPSHTYMACGMVCLHIQAAAARAEVAAIQAEARDAAAAVGNAESELEQLAGLQRTW